MAPGGGGGGGKALDSLNCPEYLDGIGEYSPEVVFIDGHWSMRLWLVTSDQCYVEFAFRIANGGRNASVIIALLISNRRSKLVGLV